MFQWDKTIESIDIPASQVMHLFRSMRDVQLALPGLPAQQASAYLCQYRTEVGVATVVAFHLHKHQHLAFYFNEPRIEPDQKTDAMFDQGLNFVESMGFLMTDQDIHLLDEADQEMLWASLPLKAGLPMPGQQVSKATAEPGAKPAVQAQSTPSADIAANQNALNDYSIKESQQDKSSGTEKQKEGGGAQQPVDDLLAAVEAMRAKRPGLRARKTPPPPEEIARRRQKLRESVGRILASL